MKKETEGDIGNMMNCLKHFRLLKGISQQELADRVSMSLSQISNLENGRSSINNLRAISLYNISKVLGCEMEDLLEVVEE